MANDSRKEARRTKHRIHGIKNRNDGGKRRAAFGRRRSCCTFESASLGNSHSRRDRFDPGALNRDIKMSVVPLRLFLTCVVAKEELSIDYDIRNFPIRQQGG